MSIPFTINLAVWHCSADPEGSFEGKDMAYYDRIHREQRKFRKIGYHIVVFPDGHHEYGRGIEEVGAHAQGYNIYSIGIMYQGGLDAKGRPKDTRTPEQKAKMRVIKNFLDYFYPGIEHVGHRDLSVDLNGDGVITPNEWMKQCPCFNVTTEL